MSENEEATTTVDLTAREVQVLTCAMAGNHPDGLADVRMPVLRKLAKADAVLPAKSKEKE